MLRSEQTSFNDETKTTSKEKYSGSLNGNTSKIVDI